MPTPPSGQIDIGTINANFGRGTNLAAYRGTIWYQPGTLNYGYFPGGAISLSDFYNKQPNDPATSGVLDYQSPGNYAITIPLYRNYFRVQVWGAGGSGGPASGPGRADGGNSSILGVTGGGGQGGFSGYGYRTIGSPGAGGGAAGGNEANLGGGGGYGAGIGGNGANGGAGGARQFNLNATGYSGGFPGGGGGGGNYDNYKGYWQIGGGGGGGGYAQTVWGPGALGAGSVVGLTVGAGGTSYSDGYGGAGGSGGNGRILITWG